MSKTYLAINYGPYEGWTLTPFDTPFDAFMAAKKGESYGNEWKILKEFEITINQGEEEKKDDR